MNNRLCMSAAKNIETCEIFHETRRMCPFRRHHSRARGVPLTRFPRRNPERVYASSVTSPSTMITRLGTKVGTTDEMRLRSGHRVGVSGPAAKIPTSAAEARALLMKDGTYRGKTAVYARRQHVDIHSSTRILLVAFHMGIQAQGSLVPSQLGRRRS